MCAKSKGHHRCRGCGSEPAVPSGHCTRLVQLGPGKADRTEAHDCGACCRDLATDAARDEYVRLGLLA